VGSTVTKPGVTTASSAASIKVLAPGITPSVSQWARAVLIAAQLPVNDVNVNNLDSWVANEQDASSRTQGVNGAHGPLGNMGGTATNASESAIQTAQLLTTSSSYTNIVKALQKSVPLAMFAGAVTSTPWNAPSDYGGTTAFLARAKLHNYGNYSATGTNLSTPDPTGLSGDVLHFFNDALGGGYPFFGSSTETGASGQTGGSDTAAVTAPISTIDGLIKDITNPTTLKNVGIFVGGLALMGTGLLIFFAQTKSAKAVEGAAVKAA
jgi:hypothetical protein